MRISGQAFDKKEDDEVVEIAKRYLFLLNFFERLSFTRGVTLLKEQWGAYLYFLFKQESLLEST